MEPATKKRYRFFIDCTALVSVICFLVSASLTQTTEARQPDMAFSQELNKYPGLLPEFGQLLEKLKQDVQFPAPRRQSKILPLLSPSTTYYAAFPNYGEPAHQALTRFREELKHSSVLRNWWQQGDMAKAGPQVEDWIDRFYSLSQYLGEEIVISGETGGSGRNLLIVAEVRKPGLKDFLRQMLKEIPDKSKSDLRILDLHELATAKSRTKPEGLVVLVRPDFMIAAPELEAVRRFNGLLEAKGGTFASTPFGQRLLQAYQSGTTVLAAGDLQTVMRQIPSGTQAIQSMLDRSGFKDVKYLVWDHKQLADHGVSETELSFIGPRHGVASWLAAPAPLGSLDFVSPKAVLVMAAALKNLAEVFDGVKELAISSHPNAFAALPQMEQAMQISLRDDVLSQLQGEITFELRDFADTQPVWNVILRVNDHDRLQKTLDRLFLNARVPTRQFDEAGVHYYSVVAPSAQKPVEIVYTFVDGYLIVGSSRESAIEAIGLHRSGDSLAKSTKLLASLPPGYSPEMSALLYQDAAAMMALQLRRLSPEIAATLSRLTPETTPVTYRAYGEDSTIRGVSASAAADPAAVLIVAAIAIPNLLRARIAANESSAIAALRTVNVAEITYSSTYPQRGYARDLATLGPDPHDASSYSPNHANMIDDTLGNAICTASTWCQKSGYSFNLRAVCKERVCKEFVVVGTPVSSSTGTRNFCSTSDGVIRFQVGPVAAASISVTECREWPPLR
jgi:type II secretory pathway pseudopilin PulG